MASKSSERRAAIRDLTVGLVSLAVGLVVTVFSWRISHGTRAVVATGALAAGLIETVRGLRGLGGSFRWFVAWRYLMAPPPRRVSPPLVTVALLFWATLVFATVAEVWVPLMPPFMFGGPAVPPAYFFAIAAVSALPFTYLLLAAVIATTTLGGPRSLRVSLWLALVTGLASLALIGLYGAMREAADAGARGWVTDYGAYATYVVAALCLLGFLGLLPLPERLTRWVSLVLSVLFAVGAWLLYPALQSQLVDLAPTWAPEWPNLILAGLGATIFVIAAVFWLLRSAGQRRGLDRRESVSREGYDRGLGRWEALALAGATLAVLALLFIACSEIRALGKPVLDQLGIDVQSEFRPLWLPGLQRGAIILGSFVVALVLIRYSFSFFTTVSVGGVMLGTMALIIVLSVMGGFENDLRQKILGSNAHILVTRPDGSFKDYREVGKRLSEVPGVVAYSPFVQSEVVIAARSNYANVIIKGVDPMQVGHVTQLAEDVEQDFEHPLERLYPLAPDGGVLGPPPTEAALPAPFDAGPATDAMDPVPADFEVPDFDPVDLSGGELPAAPGSADAGPTEMGARSPEGYDPPPDDLLDLPAGDPMDLSGGLSADAIADAGAIPGSEPGTARGDGSLDEDALIDELDGPLHEPLGGVGDDLGPLEPAPLGEAPLGIAPEIAELPGVLVGSELVKTLSNYVGQEVTVVSPLGEDTPLGPAPRTKRYRVAGWFYTGMYEYDLKYVYVELHSLQDFLDIGDEVNGIEIRIVDPDRSGVVMNALRQELGDQYRVQDWRELNKSLFSALKLEKIVMFVVLVIIILVASFSIVGNLVMIVVEKAREIAVIKTLGATDRSVTEIFIGQGFVIGWVGMLVGVSLGLFHTLVTLDGFPLDPNVYYIDRLPINLDPLSVLYVALAAIVISALATIYPARLAAAQRPVEGLTRE